MVTGLFLLSPCFTDSPVFSAVNVDPDQTHYVVSDQDLLYLSVPFFGDARPQWVKYTFSKHTKTRHHVNFLIISDSPDLHFYYIKLVTRGLGQAC